MSVCIVPDLFILGEVVPSEVDADTVAEVPNELGLGVGILPMRHDKVLHEPGEEEHLCPAEGRDVPDMFKASANGCETRPVQVDVTGEAHPSCCSAVTHYSKHGDAAMLQLNLAEAVETVLVGISKETEGVPKSQRRLSTERFRERGGGRTARRMRLQSWIWC